MSQKTHLQANRLTTSHKNQLVLISDMLPAPGAYFRFKLTFMESQFRLLRNCVKVSSRRFLTAGSSSRDKRFSRHT